MLLQKIVLSILIVIGLSIGCLAFTNSGIVPSGGIRDRITTYLSNGVQGQIKSKIEGGAPSFAWEDTIDGAGSAFWVSTLTGRDLVWNDGASNRIWFLYGGNIGIGTSPTTVGKLVVQSNVVNVPAVYVNNDDSGNWAAEFHSDGFGLHVKTDTDVTDTNPLLQLSNSTSIVFRVQEDGSVAIGKLPPSGFFDLSPGTTGSLYLEGAEATVDITAVDTCTIEVNVPSGSKVIGVQLRVDTALAGGETWNAQYVTGSTQSIASTQAVAQNTKVNKFFNVNADTDIASAEVDITIQRSSNPGVDAFTAQGTIRAIVYYQAFSAMADF